MGKRKSKSKNRKIIDLRKISTISGLSLGIIFLILSVIEKMSNSVTPTIEAIMKIYYPLGYDLTSFGIIVGTLYGFATGFMISILIIKVIEKIKK